MEIPKLEFKSLKEIKNFLAMNKTDHANYYVKMMQDDIKIIGKEQDVYFYDKCSKLWKCETKEVYNGCMADFLNETGKSLLKCYKKIVAAMEEMDDDENIKILKQINTLKTNFDSSSYINDIITRSTGKLQDNKFVTKLNNTADYFPIKFGKKVDLRTLEVTDRVKQDYFSIECPVDMTKHTKHADKFFEQVMPDKDNREYLRKILGYSLSGSMDARCFFIWYGDGSNGKSVIMRIMKEILKEFYHQCGKGIFMKGSDEKVSGPSPDKIALIGVRCATYSEGETSDNIEMNESFLKMVSGKDPINARQLFRATLEFIPQCKLHMLTNYTPPLNGDASIRDRIRYIFLDSRFVDNPKGKNEFKRDEDFIDSLCEDYLSEAFTWIVKGCKTYYETKTIVPSEEFRKRTDEVFNLEDSITSFISTQLVITSDDKDYERRGILFEQYKLYCNDNSQRCKPRSTLFKRLEDLKIRIVKKDGYDVYRGLKVVTEHKKEEPKKEEPLKEEPIKEEPKKKKISVNKFFDQLL